jgi:hypothetical protein
VAVATYTDVEVALGRPISTPTEQAQVEWWLNGTEFVIRGRLGDPALLDQDVLVYVETEAVAAKVRRGARDESSITVSVDDGSVTRRYDSPVSAEDIGGELWGLLSPASSATSYTIGVVSPVDLP